MSGKLIITDQQRVDLRYLIGKDALVKSIAEHYKTNMGSYSDLAKQYAGMVVKIANVEKRYTGEQLVAAVARQIADFDGVLYELATNPAFKDKLRSDFPTICSLFARNAWAENPVLPGA